MLRYERTISSDVAFVIDAPGARNSARSARIEEPAGQTDKGLASKQSLQEPALKRALLSRSVQKLLPNDESSFLG
jgi:hypothetical protein